MIGDQSTFGKWYAANCLLAWDEKTALRAAWNAAVKEAVKECERVKTAMDGGATAGMQCVAQVVKLGE